jgi:hypothetical protein
MAPDFLQYRSPVWIALRKGAASNVSPSCENSSDLCQGLTRQATHSSDGWTEPRKKHLAYRQISPVCQEAVIFRHPACRDVLTVGRYSERISSMCVSA